MNVSRRVQTIIFSGLFLCLSASTFLSLLIVTSFVCLLLEQCRLPTRLSISISKVRLWFARLCVASSVILFCGRLSLHVILKLHSVLANGIGFCLAGLKFSLILAMLVIGIVIHQAANMVFIARKSGAPLSTEIPSQ